MSLPPGIEPVRGDLSDNESLGRLVEGCDALMHLAGAVRGSTASDFNFPNVDGTARLIAQCSARAPRLPVLFFSSLAAREPQLSHYAASKRRAEDLFPGYDGPWLVLRPPAVYGPGDKEMLPVFRFMARTGFAPCAGRRSDRLSLVFVDDLVDASVAWLPRRERIRAVCSLHDGHTGGYDWPDLAEAAAAVCGRRVRVWELPTHVLDIAARANRSICRLTGRQPMLSPEKLRELRHPDWVCDNDDITSLVDWAPATSLEDGLAATPGWARN